MKDPKQKNEEGPDASLDPALDSLIQAVMETLNSEDIENAEPFEVYVHKVHSSVYSDSERASSSFVKGYHTLLNELNNN